MLTDIFEQTFEYEGVMTTELSLTYLSGRRENEVTTPQHSVARKTAGWPSPAQDYYSGELDLNKALVPNPDSTYLLRIVGDAMSGAGICHGDEVMIDRSLQPKSGDIVVAIIDAEFVVRRLEQRSYAGMRTIRLKAEHPQYPYLIPAPEEAIIIRGVVTICIHYL